MAHSDTNATVIVSALLQRKDKLPFNLISTIVMMMMILINFDFYYRDSFQVWFKNKRAKCRQIQKQNTVTKPGETQTPSNVAKKTAAATTTKLKPKTSSSLLSTGTNALISETSNFIKAQNPFLIPTGSSKVFYNYFKVVNNLEEFRINQLTFYSRWTIFIFIPKITQFGHLHISKYYRK